MSPDSHSNVISPKQGILELVSADPIGLWPGLKGSVNFLEENTVLYILQGGKFPPSSWISRIIAFYQAAS